MSVENRNLSRTFHTVEMSHRQRPRIVLEGDGDRSVIEYPHDIASKNSLLEAVQAWSRGGPEPSHIDYNYVG